MYFFKDHRYQAATYPFDWPFIPFEPFALRDFWRCSSVVNNKLILPVAEYLKGRCLNILYVADVQKWCKILSLFNIPESNVFVSPLGYVKSITHHCKYSCSNGCEVKRLRIVHLDESSLFLTGQITFS